MDFNPLENLSMRFSDSNGEGVIHISKIRGYGLLDSFDFISFKGCSLRKLKDTISTSSSLTKLFVARTEVFLFKEYGSARASGSDGFVNLKDTRKEISGSIDISLVEYVNDILVTKTIYLHM
ncbi:hypothetical protein MTR_8g468080 [Medicago truncatula]|uniref:Uncharacterized protein n=1 Tax=Medicago truncatula TaxID=3880 RepID=A0A072U1V5_MEDTR|nr:hypothetical protein MTR_8g468080 [Medicago truncatula]